MLTLAHELAHLWLGEVGDGLSGYAGIFPDGGQVETFCDRAAAEFLVPASELQAAWPKTQHKAAPFEVLARRFKVSPIVVGRRAMDLQLVSRDAFFAFYNDYTQQERRTRSSASGGDFYRNQNARVGIMFATKVIHAAQEGRIGFKTAYELTGLNGGTFQKYVRELGIQLP